MSRLLLTSACFLMCMTLQAQRLEDVPFGDFEQWTERHIKESAIIGGNTRTIYAIAPSATIDGNIPFDFSNTIWATSNAYANVLGVVKTSCSVIPDKGPDGTCAKLSSCFASCKVAGLVNIKVLATGSIYWGKMLEPVTGVSEPYAFMDWGIEFSKRPSALVLDYRSIVPDSGTIVKGTTFKTTYFEGHDPEEILFILQNRTEDAKGNVHARRVGTAVYRISSSSDGWVKGLRIPVIYGDARKDPSYKSYMDLIPDRFYTLNSKGDKKLIVEEGWAEPSAPVTHAIMMISSGSCGAFTGAVDNILWVDNIKLEYE